MKSSPAEWISRYEPCLPTVSTIDEKIVPQSNEARYLGLHLDSNFTEARLPQSYTAGLLLNDRKKVTFSLDGKRLIYIMSIIKPIWMYGMQLWGTAKPSNCNIMQRVKNKVLWMITCAPSRYITNRQLLKDLNMKTKQLSYEY